MVCLSRNYMVNLALGTLVGFASFWNSSFSVSSFLLLGDNLLPHSLLPQEIISYDSNQVICIFRLNHYWINFSKIILWVSWLDQCNGVVKRSSRIEPSSALFGISPQNTNLFCWREVISLCFTARWGGYTPDSTIKSYLSNTAQWEWKSSYLFVVENLSS